MGDILRSQVSALRSLVRVIRYRCGCGSESKSAKVQPAYGLCKGANVFPKIVVGAGAGVGLQNHHTHLREQAQRTEA